MLSAGTGERFVPSNCMLRNIAEEIGEAVVSVVGWLHSWACRRDQGQLNDRRRLFAVVISAPEWWSREKRTHIVDVDVKDIAGGFRDPIPLASLSLKGNDTPD